MGCLWPVMHTMWRCRKQSDENNERYLALQAMVPLCLAMQALSDGTTPSSIYGGEHLLRLCYKLPEFLSVSSMSADDQLQLEMRLAGLVSFLKKNEGLFTLPAAEART